MNMEVVMCYMGLAVTTSVVAWVVLWLYNYLSSGVCHSKADMEDKVVIITGATAGIGKVVAMDLARRGVVLIIGCRDLDKGNKVKDEIVKATQNFAVLVFPLDMSLMSSVRSFVKKVQTYHTTLNVLIHNAGVWQPSSVVTEEGLHTTWATNHFGPFLLTNLLVDMLKKTKNSRVVVVSSVAHRFGQIDLNNINPLHEPRQYMSTKLANILFTNELSRRLQPWGVTANSLHPGCVKTNIWEGAPWLLRLYLKLSTPFLKTVEQGAQTIIYLAVSEEVEGVTGKYFSDCKETTPSSISQDEGLAKKLWEISEKITRMTPADPHI